MPVSPDLTPPEFRYSVSAATGDSTAGDTSSSVGGKMSTTVFVDGANTLFPDITEADNAAETEYYKCIFFYNTDPSLDLENLVVYISSQDAAGSNVELSVDTTGATTHNTSSAQAKSVADYHTAPSAQVFSTPYDFDNGLALPDLGPSECVAIWVKNKAQATPYVAYGDYVNIRVYYEIVP